MSPNDGDATREPLCRRAASASRPSRRRWRLRPTFRSPRTQSRRPRCAATDPPGGSARAPPRMPSTTCPIAAVRFHLGAYPFEKLKRRDETTTFIDEPRVPRFPKRADFFARAVFGDMGKEMQNNAKGGFYVQKSAIGACARRALGALLLLQFGEARGPVSPTVRDPDRNAREREGRLLLHGDRRRRALALSGMGLLQPRCRRQRDEALPQERGLDALRPGPRDVRGRERRRLDFGGAEHARLSALLASGRHRRRADPPARLLGARAYRARRRRAAAAAAAAVRASARCPASAR